MTSRTPLRTGTTAGLVPTELGRLVTLTILELGSNPYLGLLRGTQGDVTAPATSSPCIAATQSAVWINEIHYENSGADANEGVEVAGPAGVSLHGMTIHL